MSDLVLSLFPGIGLLDRAFEEEGFCVVRGPDLLWGGDVRRFHPPAGRFDGVIGGPPCQAFSPLQRLVEHNRRKHPERYQGGPPVNLIPEYERVVAEAQPRWFLMENVPAAPEPIVAGYAVRSALVDNRTDAGGEQQRIRRFSFGTPDGRTLAMPWWKPPVPEAWAPTVCASGSTWAPVRFGGGGKPKPLHLRSRTSYKSRGHVYGNKTRAYLSDAIRLQGLPDGWSLPGFTVRESVRAVGNGVPLPLGRAIARAVRNAISQEAA